MINNIDPCLPSNEHSPSNSSSNSPSRRRRTTTTTNYSNQNHQTDQDDHDLIQLIKDHHNRTIATTTTTTATTKSPSNPTHHQSPSQSPPRSPSQLAHSSSSSPSNHQLATIQQQQQQYQQEQEHQSSNLYSQAGPLDPSLSNIINNQDLITDPKLLEINKDHGDQPNPSKRKRSLSDREADNLNSHQASLDTLHLARLITSIQNHHQSSTGLEPGSSSQPSTTTYSSQMILPDAVENEFKEKIINILNPIKLEISRLRSRIEILEDERLTMAREITSLKGLLNKSTYQGSLNGLNYHHSSTPLGIGHMTPNRTSDIPVGPIPDALAGQIVSSASLNSLPHPSTSNPHDANQPSHPAVASFSTPLQLNSSNLDNLPFRRSSIRKKLESSPSLSTPNVNSSAKSNRAKHRKPELSRTVRATVFRLMGVSSNHSPLSSDNYLPNEACKFGNEKSRAYHGYTTSPCFPEYTAEELFDPETKAKIWRWEWSKTIRQSQNNTNFAKEIRNVIVREAADPRRPLHTEVPPGDWQYLDDAIDSAYTNMRRERDNLIDPTKMVKKEVHRARNKKRGLKEDKFKRRRKALDEYRADPQIFSQRLGDLNLQLGEKPSSVGDNDQKQEQSQLQQDSERNEALEEERWDDALDIKYMSSEDEANVNDFENPISIGVDKSDNTLAASDKVFSICRPEWRSHELQNLYTVLDAIKQPERAYRRVMGPIRISRPPAGTPTWMIKEGYGECPAMKTDS